MKLRLLNGIGSRLNQKNNITITAALAAGLICLLAYFPALNCDFVNYDDYAFVKNNPAIRILDLEFINWAFTTSYQGWWMPLVWISFAVDYHFWGLNPLGYHLTNILFHAINAGLIVIITDRVLKLGRFTDSSDGEQGTGTSWVHSATLVLAGLLWGLHPINVESVAWVAERKNVLNGIFSLGCILLYLGYLDKKEQPGEKNSSVRYYVFSVIFLQFALMTKPVSVVIPLILLMLDWCLFGRLQNGNIIPVIVEKIPYLLLSALIAFATIFLASGQSILVPLDTYPLFSRFISSGATLFDYCMIMLYPDEIIVMYLLPHPLPTAYYVKTALVVCFTIYCLVTVGRRSWLSAAWLCYLLPVLPTLHFFMNGANRISLHFAYLPSIAPCIAASAIIAYAYKKSLPVAYRFAAVLIVVMTVSLLLSYLVITERLIGSWKNDETLWTRVINIKPVGRAYFYRALYLMENRRYSEAVDDLQASIKMALSARYPKVYELYAFSGSALYKAGRYEEALEAFTAAIKLNPRPNYFYHRGLVYKAKGSTDEAESDFSVAGRETGPVTPE